MATNAQDSARTIDAESSHNTDDEPADSLGSRNAKMVAEGAVLLRELQAVLQSDPHIDEYAILPALPRTSNSEEMTFESTQKTQTSPSSSPSPSSPSSSSSSSFYLNGHKLAIAMPAEASAFPLLPPLSFSIPV
ncbi:hypothetical protein CLOP_g1272 [Closterium sp. NIES-67]|nr:hypothetical protein CLOP_g1272 [Closterium sp. NIES-67]